jgi:hypothetical protein
LLLLLCAGVFGLGQLTVTCTRPDNGWPDSFQVSVVAGPTTGCGPEKTFTTTVTRTEAPTVTVDLKTDLSQPICATAGPTTLTYTITTSVPTTITATTTAGSGITCKPSVLSGGD